MKLIISSNLTNTRAQAKVDGNKLGSETKHFPHTHREVIMTHGVLLFSPRGHIKGLLTSWMTTKKSKLFEDSRRPKAVTRPSTATSSPTMAKTEMIYPKKVGA